MAETANAQNGGEHGTREERKNHPNLSVNTKEAHKYQSFQNQDKKFYNWKEIRAMGKLPSRRSYHCSGFYKDELYIYGGEDIREGIVSNMYKINIERDSDVIEWQPVESTGDGPGAISHHTGVVHEGKWYLFGGNREDGAEVGWVYIFDYETCSWTTVKAEGAPILDDHSAIVHQGGDSASMIVFGGFHFGSRTNKVYKFCLKNQTWSILFEGTEGPT
eukprot:CAMPEP_0114987920 /NCGR_PEP_ID=MMETSP0216-20121206/9293_1 /TAXON_ID=223996 /ORGANISM="Protocruzia adherens, Strain Boccale" /LENGTH=217 /DNA_ID=CAMNT_0002350607 /DNA_START=30 /DNA_END=679 /DNA_ORIENTATION=-